MAPRGELRSYANGERRKQELADAALEVFAREGYRRLSLRQIAEAIGTSHVLLGYHFGTKAGLLQAVITRREERDAEWREQTIRELGVLDGVTEIIRRGLASRGLVLLDVTLRAEALDPSHPAHEFVRRRESDFYKTLATRLREDLQRGDIRADIDVELVARQFTALLEGLQVQWLYDDSIDVAATMKAFLATLVTASPSLAR